MVSNTPVACCVCVFTRKKKLTGLIILCIHAFQLPVSCFHYLKIQSFVMSAYCMILVVIFLCTVRPK